jgi:hypothetical protein
LEVVEDLSTNTFVRAYHRFAARRSYPTVVYSDRGTYFVAASQQLKVKWKFIISRAPWTGFWERLIGYTKTALKKVLGQAMVSFDELSTITTQVEAMINDRPLTYVSNELDQPRAITPSQLLYGHDIHCPSNENEQLEEFSHINLNARQKKCEKLKDHIWKRWQTEYLHSLREKHHYVKSKHIICEPKIDDIVLIFSESKRSNWKLGRIIQLYPSSDGLIHSVRLKTSTGFIDRHIKHLYPLEVDVKDQIDTLRRSTRSASTKATQYIAQQMSEEDNLD